jgi:hypothetical protein
MIIRCIVCHADPCGRWKKPPVMIFVDPHRDDGGRYACRDCLSEKREAEIRAREKDIGWPPGGLR